MDPVRIKRRKPINRKTKLNIVFDEAARREFLTGFRKRKLQRKLKAQEELKQKMKEERKRIKLQAHTRLKLSYQPIPEVEELLKTTGTEYDMGDHSVSIVEISTDVLQKKNNYIGENRVQYEENVKEEPKTENESEEEISGMELKTRKEIKKAIKKETTQELKKSKAYQIKKKQEQVKQRQKSLQLKQLRLKIRMKKQKKNKKHKKKK